MEHHTADPAAMRAQAATYQSMAEEMRDSAHRLDARVGGMTFRGGAAERLRTATADRSRRARAVADELEHTAQRVLQAAAAAEQGGTTGNATLS